MRQKAEQPDTIIEGDDHHALSGELLALIGRVIAAAALKAAAMNPDQHRQPRAGRGVGRPHIQIEAILAHTAEGAEIPADTGGTELAGSPGVAPAFYRLGWPPAQGADRRR